MAAEEGICVAIRMRPLNGREKIQGQNSLWRCLPAYNSITQMNPDGTPMPERNPGFTFFTYDKVFGEQSTTQEVYEAVGRPIVQSVLQGFNGTVFAYGQTSSGKTFTMVGGGETDVEEGMLHLAARDIFQLISETLDRDFLLRVSYVEIYNENIRDLLDPETPSLTIREDPRKGVYIEASESIITDFDSIMNALKTGSKNRRVEATAMNERSSRSHTIFRMVLESKERRAFMATDGEAGGAAVDGDVDGAVLVATLNLVDLAGSESVRHTGATGSRAKEGGKINQSLLTLSRVIHALGQEGGGHIGFRDSKLTRILQPSLSGNAKMAVVCCITPAERYLEETRSTLQFASRAKMVKTRAVVNEVLDDRAQLKRLKKELQELKERQKQLESGGVAGVSVEDVSRLEAEKELMSGKVEQLEAERHEQANKIDRLTNLILQGGELMSHATGVDPLRRGGRLGRRGKRLRETWCPGESKGLPPGAALRSLKELVEDDEADDLLVSNLNFGKVSKRRGGSSVSGTSDPAPRTSSISGTSSDDSHIMMVDEGAFKSDFPEGQQPEQEQRSAAMTVVEQPGTDSSSTQELSEIRAVLSAHAEFFGGEEAGGDVVSMVKAMAEALTKQRQQSSEEVAEPAGAEVMGKEEVGDKRIKEVQEQVDMAMAEKESTIISLHESLTMRAEVEMATLRATVESLQQELATKTQELEVVAVERATTEELMARLKEAMGLADQVESASQADVMARAVEMIQNVGDKVKQTGTEEEEEEGMDVPPTEAEACNKRRSEAALALHAAGREAMDTALLAEIESLRAQLAEATTAAEQAGAGEEVVARLEEQVRELQATNEGFKTAYQEVEVALSRETESFKEQKAELEESMASISNERGHYAREVDRLTEELQAVREQAETAAAELQEQLTTQEAAMADAQAAKDVLELELQEQTEQLRQQISTLEAALDEAKQQQSVDESSMEEAASAAELEELRGQMANAVEQLLVVRALFKTSDADAEEGTFEVPTTLADAVQHISEVAQAKATQISQLQASIAALSEEFQKLEERLFSFSQQAEAGDQQGRRESREPSRASLMRQSAGGVATGPPQPLLDELRLKLGSSSVGENQQEDEENEDEEQEKMAEDTIVSEEEEDVSSSNNNEDKNDETESSEVEAAAGEHHVAIEDEDTDEEDDTLRAASVMMVAPTQQPAAEASDSAEEVQSLRTRVTELQQMVDRLTEDSTGLQEEVSRLQTAFAEAQTGADESRSLLSERQAEVDLLTEQLQQLQETLNSMEGSVSSDEAQRLVAQLEEVRAEATASTEAKEAELEGLRVKVSSTAEELDSLRETHMREVAVSEKLVQDLEEEITGSRAEVEALARRVKELEEEQQQQSQAEASNDGLQAEMQERVETVTTELNSLAEQLVQKEEDMARERQRVEELEAQLAASAQMAADNTSSNADSSSNVVESEEGSSAEAKVQRLQGLLVNEQNARQEAENGFATLHTELNEARAQLRRAEKEYEERVKEQEAAHAQARKELERQVTELAMQEADANQLREQLDTMTAELNRTREELNQSRSVAEDSVNDDACLRKRVSQLQTQLDLAESKASKHEARVKEVEDELRKTVRAAEDEQEHVRKQLQEAELVAAQQGGRDAELLALKDSCTAMSNKLTTLKTERDEAEERANRAADAIEALEKELEGLRQSASASDNTAASELESLKADLEDALSQAAEKASDASQLQVRLRRAQQEVETLRSECVSVREQLEQASEARQEGAKAVAEAEKLRAEKSSSEEEVRRLQRAMEVMEGHLEEERVEVRALNLQVERLTGLQEKQTEEVAQLQQRVEEAEAATKAAETAKAELLKEMNALFLAECDAKLQIEQKEQEISDLKKALAEAESASSSNQEENAGLVDDLRAQLARKESEYSTVQGDNYRMKRELSELREAAEAAEVAIASHTEEMDKVQRALKRKSREMEDMGRELQAKEERIKHLDKAKLTTDQVERLQKLKKEWAQFQTENEKLKQELQSVQQALHDVSRSNGGADGEVAEALEAQSSTITELMSVRETLTNKLRTAHANCRKMEIERSSVFEMLQELPSESIRFDQVPEDLSVAVGMLIEKYLTEVAEGRKEHSKSHTDRSVLMNEVKTLTDEKESLKRKVHELEQSLAMSELREEELKGQTETRADKAAGTEAKLREVEAARAAAQEEATRSIRFLEKENLELMMEIKELKTRIIKLQTEVETLRSGMLPPSSSSSQHHPMTAMSPSTGLRRADVNVPHVESSHTSKNSSSSKRRSSPSSVPKPLATAMPSFTASMHDKENALGVAATALRGVSHDDTAPPFRSIADDDDDDGANASAQCRQS